MASLNIALCNNSSSPIVFAYITGRAIDRDNAVFLLQSDGKTAYYPKSPSSNGSKLAADCAIRLGGPGASRTVTIPHLAGARIWFSLDQPLTFLLNPGPGLVEPSATNPSDPNIHLAWGFCEFTWNDAQMFANISSVDFVSLPIALELESTAGTVQRIGGLYPNALARVCEALREQSRREGNPRWSSLIFRANGRDVRALSPNNGHVMNPKLFAGFYDPYVSRVWEHYRNKDLAVDTQAVWGIVSGRVVNDQLRIAGQSFDRPSTKDIFSCSDGPFGGPLHGVRAALVPRIAAAFNRSTLMNNDGLEPSRKGTRSYYSGGITNHYARIVHENETDGRGYAFPYDDVNPTGGVDRSGSVSDGSPRLLTVTVRGSGSGKLAAIPGKL
ncbi:glucanase B [Eremomyces bilateralis CBS 781.70]|uniref:Glucanase B n=1 Tax=Eremomyces bilateralis CBS 781.70 TaxID=1392243 RepID=A0A6G1GAE1_9PEZI|nr:glucanase B [Eremomyces bilateralis CBS 781.70]KAF1814906.1 glucanase B [Eremomyces bilateralis CBS 781.70]